MAESILRLTVNSSEYDNKLKQATQGLTRYADECRKVGGTLEVVEKETLDYVRALGQMDTTSRTATGKLAEMKKTFTELSVVYKNMSDQEKASPVGQALAQSLDQLKSRIGESKSQLSEINNTMNDTGGIMGMLKDKFTVNIDAVKLFSLGLQAAEGALNVAKDAFFNNEQQLDEWGRVVESSESLYKGFLNSLNTGDISGYLSNISNIVQAARDAYDALDNLSTYNAFNQINVERTRTNMTESIADYRGGKGSKDTVKAAGEAYKKELQDRKRLENEAYLAAVKRVAAERGVSAKDLTDALSGTYGHYQDLKNVQPTGVRQTVVGSGMFARTGTETFAQTRQEKLGEALRHLNDTELQSLQSLGAQAQRTGNEIAQVDKQLNRVLNGREPGSGGGHSGGGTGRKTTQEITYAADSIVAQQKLVADLTKQWNEAGADVRDQYVQPLVEAEEKLKKMKNEMALMKDHAQGKLLGGNVETSNLGNIESFKNYEVPGLDPEVLAKVKTQAQLLADEGERTKKAWASAGQAIGMVGSMMGSIKNPAAQTAAAVAQAIANIAMAYSEALAEDGTIKSNIWYFIGATAAAMVSMATTIASIHSATGYAEGGIVSGRQYSGDNIPIMANAGEVVLTKAMQGSLAQSLESPRGGGGFTASHVSGEQIWIALNAYTKRSGQGEIVTWR